MTPDDETIPLQNTEMAPANGATSKIPAKPAFVEVPTPAAQERKAWRGLIKSTSKLKAPALARAGLLLFRGMRHHAINSASCSIEPVS